MKRINTNLKLYLFSFSNQRVALAPDLTQDELQMLADNGLRAKYPVPFDQYDRHVAEADSKRKTEATVVKSHIPSQLEKERPEIERRLRDSFREDSRAFRTYARFGISAPISF